MDGGWGVELLWAGRYTLCRTVRLVVYIGGIQTAVFAGSSEPERKLIIRFELESQAETKFGLRNGLEKRLLILPKQHQRLLCKSFTHKCLEHNSIVVRIKFAGESYSQVSNKQGGCNKRVG